MAKQYDWVKQGVASAPGTGPVSLGPALPNYITMADAGAPDGELVYYTIVDGSNRERGIGTYATTGAVLTRTWVQAKLENGIYSENPGTGLSLSAEAIVGCSPVAATHNFRGCLVYNSAAFSLPQSTWTDITWNSEVYDTDNFHDLVSNTARLTIPFGISKIRLTANINFIGTGSNTRYGIRFLKGGSSGQYGQTLNYQTASATLMLTATSPVLSVTSGNYFTCQAYQEAAASMNITTITESFFHIEAIE